MKMFPFRLRAGVRARGEWLPITLNSERFGTVATNETKHAYQEDDLYSADIWEEWIGWLHREGRYNEEWGHGSRDLAADDIDNLRRACGDPGAIQCLKLACNRGLYGPVLCRHVKSAVSYYNRRRTSKCE